MMNPLSFAVLALVVLSSGCGTAFTSTLVRNDGSTVQTYPTCFTTTDFGDKMLRGTGLGQGIPANDVQEIRSHAGVESAIFGSTAVIVGSALIVWYLTDEQETQETWMVASGGAIAGLGLINAIIGGFMWSNSASALSTPCHPRARVPR